MLNVVEPNDLDQFDECRYNKLLLVLKYEIVHTSYFIQHCIKVYLLQIAVALYKKFMVQIKQGGFREK